MCDFGTPLAPSWGSKWRLNPPRLRKRPPKSIRRCDKKPSWNQLAHQRPREAPEGTIFYDFGWISVAVFIDFWELFLNSIFENRKNLERFLLERTFFERTFLERTFLERFFLERPFPERTFLERTFPERTFIERTKPPGYKMVGRRCSRRMAHSD